MNNPIYQQPSKLGAPILALLNISIDVDAITTIEWAETLHGYKFAECNVIKYLWRLGEKDDIKKECGKILDYIDRAIENESHITETLKIVELHVICLMKRHGIELPGEKNDY